MVASHEWGREGRGDCGTRVVIEESGVYASKSSPGWFGLNIHRGVKSVLPPGELLKVYALSRRVFMQGS